MKDKRIYFLAGLPRTGSTLLGSILAQNPDIHVTPTSPLYPCLVSTNELFNRLDVQHTFDKDAVSSKVYKAIVEAFFSEVTQPIIFDKHRGWTKVVESIQEYINPNVRIIATIRPIAEIITSYLVLAEKDPDNFIDTHLKKDGIAISNESRATLLWEQYLNVPYESLKIGLEKYPENILLIDYRDIVYQTKKTLDKIYAFCDIDAFNHKQTDIENKCAESKDHAWGLKHLHDIRPTLNYQSANPLAYLPKEAIEYFNQFDIHG